MSLPADIRVRRPHGRPVIGVLFGFQMFGTGRVYDFIDSLTRGIQASARDRGCSLLLGCGVSVLNLDKKRPAWPIPSTDADFVPVGPWNTDGLIVVHPLASPERTQFIRKLKAENFPLVFVGSAEGGHAIDIDNDDGMRQALAHLARHGHRRIAYIGGFPDDERGDSGARMRAFHRYIFEFGLETDPCLIEYGHHNTVDGRNAMRTIIASHVSFTAVMASNDESALGAIQVLTETGLNVPRDVAVIGFDNRLGVGYELPALTTVHHPVFERGHRSVELLLDMLDGKCESNGATIQTPTRLVIRHSCGCSLSDIVTREATDQTYLSRFMDAQISLARAISDVILDKTLYAEPAEVHDMSGQLAQALVTSLTSGREADFASTFQAILSRTEQSQRDVNIWSAVIEVLEDSQEFELLLETLGGNNDHRPFSRRLLTDARVRIAQSKWQQNWHNRHFVAETRGYLVTQLVAARNETEMLRALAEDGPRIGIRRSAIVIFEPEVGDPCAWSLMRISTDPQAAPIRFRSRDFSPADFSPLVNDPVRLALVPLVIDSDLSGYMILDCDDLSVCTTVVHAVNTALKSCQMYRQVVETSRMYQEAVELRRAAEEANTLKSRFLSAVGHELRTPLNFIVTASEFLEREKPDADSDYAHNLAHIRASAQQVEGLVRDVLDLTSDEVGQLRLACESIDIATTLKPVAALGEQLARAKGLDWRAEIPADLPNVWADRTRLRQVALNLITNAVKFTDRGGIVLRVEHDDPRLVISVQDSGVGVPLEERENIFGEFQQSSRTSGRGGGLGLGLAICRRLVEMHFGKIDVVSTDDESGGSTFFFTLPVLKTGVRALVQTLRRDQTVFLLDEHSPQTQDLQRRLTEHGFLVRQLGATDGGELLTVLENELSAIVLLSREAPAALRAKISELFRTHPETANLTVLFYSLVEEGAAVPLKLDYLTQPIGSSDLLRAIKRRGVSGDASAKTVLVVEDDPRLLDMHKKIVQTLSTSIRVLTAQNGKQAIDLVKDQLPDLVLLDLIMPEMGGFDVLDAMQQFETTRRIPVIVLSGQTLADEEMRRLNRNVTTVLTKGVFTIEETQTQIQRSLDGVGQISEAGNLVRKAMGFVHEHYQKSITRAQIAADLHISEGHLARCFRQILRVSPMTYLMRYRVNRAKELLNSSDMTLAKIAIATGFPNEYYFSYVFRREIGVAPSAFRKQQRVS